MLDLHRLNIFLKIVEMKSFSKAAQRLCLTQPTVSQHVSYLEEYLGVSLLDRSGKEVNPTQAGRILNTYASRLLRMADDAEHAIAFLKGKKAGLIVAGASNIPGEYILPEILGDFKNRYPEIGVTVQLADTAGIIEKIARYEIDLGVIGARIKHDQLQCSRFLDDELCLIISPQHAWAQRQSIDAGELVTAAFVMRETGSGTRMMIEQAFRKFGIQADQLNIVAEFGSNSAVKQAVKAGLGISFVSKRSVSDELSMNVIRAVPVKDMHIKRSFYIARHRNRSLPPIVKEFYQFLLKQRLRSQ